MLVRTDVRKEIHLSGRATSAIEDVLIFLDLVVVFGRVYLELTVVR